jgi:hypothetical protein
MPDKIAMDFTEDNDPFNPNRETNHFNNSRQEPAES